MSRPFDEMTRAGVTRQTDVTPGGGVSSIVWNRRKECEMRIFVAGATGAIGGRLVPKLVANGHAVVGTTTSPERIARIGAMGAMGAEGVLMDGLDARSVRRAVADARPEVVVHQMTALAGFTDFRKFDEAFAVTNRLRTEGTDHLLAAAHAAGAECFVAQSFAGHPFARIGGWIKTEEDPLDADPPDELRGTVEAIRYLEDRVLETNGVEGIVLRYGGFYGAGTSMATGSPIVDAIRQRKFPIVGAGTGVWSFIHVDDAAEATVAAIERGRRGIYQVVDDEPAPVSEWLPAVAEMLGARPPRRIPAWMGRILAGPHLVAMMNEIRGASNAKARRELGWTPAHPTWREGFREELTAAVAA
jgi:nucleoside-diphosphate-sugar epimerase